MSLAGLIQRHGSTVTVKRPVESETAGGGTDLTYQVVATGVRVLLDEPSAEVARRLFGEEVTIDARAMLPADADVRTDDGLEVTAGLFAGERFDVGPVTHVRTWRARSGHREAALRRRPEAYP